MGMKIDMHLQLEYFMLWTTVTNSVNGNCQAHIIHNEACKNAQECYKYNFKNHSHFQISVIHSEIPKKLLLLLKLLNWYVLNSYFVSKFKEFPTHIHNILMLNEINGNIKVQIYLHFAYHFSHNIDKALKQFDSNNMFWSL